MSVCRHNWLQVNPREPGITFTYRLCLACKAREGLTWKSISGIGPMADWNRLPNFELEEEAVLIDVEQKRKHWAYTK